MFVCTGARKLRNAASDGTYEDGMSVFRLSYISLIFRPSLCFYTYNIEGRPGYMATHTSHHIACVEIPINELTS